MNAVKIARGQIAASVAAAGSTAADAGVLTGHKRVYPTSAADGTKGVLMHLDDAYTGNVVHITNTAAAVLKVYPPTGGTINGGSANAAVSTVSGKGITLICVTGAAAGGTWASV